VKRKITRETQLEKHAQSVEESREKIVGSRDLSKWPKGSPEILASKSGDGCGVEAEGQATESSDIGALASMGPEGNGKAQTSVAALDGGEDGFIAQWSIPRRMQRAPVFRFLGACDGSRVCVTRNSLGTGSCPN
jgi:hypothetical protein